MGKISLSIYMKGDYEEFHAQRRRKNKANSKPICRPLGGNPKHEVRNERNGIKMTEPYLKKQSQFLVGENELKYLYER